jgi:hypothetical protein
MFPRKTDIAKQKAGNHCLTLKIPNISGTLTTPHSIHNLENPASGPYQRKNALPVNAMPPVRQSEFG